MEPFELLLHKDAIDSFKKIRGISRKNISGFFDYIEDDPFLEPDSTYDDAKGRCVNQIWINDYLLEYIVDAPVKEIKIIEISKVLEGNF